MKSLAVLESETHATIARVKADVAGIRQRAADAGRVETSEERAEIDRLLREGESAKTNLARRQSDDAMSARIQALVPAAPLSGGAVLPGSGRTLGAQFVASEVYQYLKTQRGSLPQKFTTPSAELPWPGLLATVLTSTTAGGESLIAPDDRGIAPSPGTGPIGVADLLPTAPTSSNAIFYLVETGFTNAAAPVAEAGVKPESGLTFEPRTDPVRKIAHWLPVTDEFVEDEPAMRGYIDMRLRDGIAIKEDDQLLNGDGVAPNVEGILARDGLGAPIARGASESNADAIARQMSALSIATGLPMTGIVMNPVNWAAIETSKDDAGSYLGGGPFAQLPRRSLWGVPVALSAAMAAGSALVGAFRGAAGLFRKGGIRVEISNSHQDYFVRDLLAIRAETRVSLVVFRPAAFGLVTGLEPVVTP